MSNTGNDYNRMFNPVPNDGPVQEVDLAQQPNVVVPEQRQSAILRRSTFRQMNSESMMARQQNVPDPMDNTMKGKIRNGKIRDTIFDLVMFGVVIGLTLDKIKSARYCSTPIIQWLLVYSGIYFLSAIRNILVIILIYTSQNSKKAKDTTEGLYCCCVFNFQVAWLIYGNTFHYSRESYACKDYNEESNSLWVLMTVILAFGYLILLVWGLACCFISCVFCCACVNRRQMNLRNNPVVDRIPYVNAVQSLNKKKFENVQEQNKNMEQCIICMLDYKDDDEIAELKCDAKHYFHSKCLEEWLHRKLECPLCKQPVQP